MTVSSSDIQLGVSLYSYGGDYLVTMTLEDCLADIADMGATGVEILSDTHIPGYPNPTDAWVEEWHGLLKKYGLTPTCYSCWVDTRLHAGRDLTVEEAVAILRRDLELAHRLGFTIIRPKLGVVSQDLIPDPVWREAVESVLPDAQRLNIKITPEIHAPTPLKSKIVDDYLALTKETGTQNFGLLVDAGVFQTKVRTGEHSDSKQIMGNVTDPEIIAETRRRMSTPLAVDPADMAEVMPYVYHIHGKFWEMTDDLTDPHITVWDGIVKTLVEGGYKGSISSEYEGARDLYLASDVLRRQHVMLRRLLAENGVEAPFNRFAR